jgi:hypothetical protein
MGASSAGRESRPVMVGVCMGSNVAISARSTAVMWLAKLRRVVRYLR